MTFEQWVATQTSKPNPVKQNAADQEKLNEKKERAIEACKAYIARLRQKRRKK